MRRFHLIAFAVAVSSTSDAAADEKVPAPVFDRIDYGHPNAYLAVGATWDDVPHL